MSATRKRCGDLYTGFPGGDRNDYEYQQREAFDPSCVSPGVKESLAPTERGETHRIGPLAVGEVVAVGEEEAVKWYGGIADTSYYRGKKERGLFEGKGSGVVPVDISKADDVAFSKEAAEELLSELRQFENAAITDAQRQQVKIKTEVVKGRLKDLSGSEL